MGNKLVGLIIFALLLAQFPGLVYARDMAYQVNWDLGQVVNENANTVNKIEVTPLPAVTAPTNNVANTPVPQLINKATVIAPAKLITLINTTLQRDNNIRRVEIVDNQIKVDYQQTTKLLGLIPVRFNLRIVADPSQKQLNINRPWWAILGNTNVKKIFDQLKSGMNSLNPTSPTSQVGQQSQIVQTISSVMKQNFTTVPKTANTTK